MCHSLSARGLYELFSCYLKKRKKKKWLSTNKGPDECPIGSKKKHRRRKNHYRDFLISIHSVRGHEGKRRKNGVMGQQL